MIRNLNKKRVIARRHFTCSTIFSIARGLMFARPKTLLFKFQRPRKVAIHMWFVFFPIDLAFLDETFRVVDLKRGIKPFQFYTSKTPAAYLVETPAGLLKGTSIGDKISVSKN